MTGAFVCPYCEQGLESVRALEKHVENIHGIGAESNVSKEEIEKQRGTEKKMESHEAPKSENSKK